MSSYRFLVQQLCGFFDGCEFHHVPRANNEGADALSMLGSTRSSIPTGISLEKIKKPSITPSPESESIFIPAGLEIPAPSSDNTKKPSPESESILIQVGSVAPRVPSKRIKKLAAKPSPDSESILSLAGSQPSGAPTSAKKPKKKSHSAAPGAVGSAEPAAPGAADCVPGADFVSSGTDSIVQDTVGSTSTEAFEPVAAAVLVVLTAPSWAQPLRDFLVDGTLPEDEVRARQIQRRSGAYTIINNELLHRSTTGVFQHCVEPNKGLELLRDIHQGECGHHASAKAIVAKAFCHGFYWPTILAVAEDLVKKCNGCQRLKSKSHEPASALKTIPITWPFAVWGLDMVGPFKTAKGGMTHLLVAVDKFTK